MAVNNDRNKCCGGPNRKSISGPRGMRALPGPPLQRISREAMRQKAGSAPTPSQGTNPEKPLRPAWPEGPPLAPTAADQPGRLCVGRQGSAPAPSQGRNPEKPLCSAWPERAPPRPPLPRISPGGYASEGRQRSRPVAGDKPGEAPQARVA
jgi:hypothetical protein